MIVLGIVLIILALVVVAFMWFGTAELDPLSVDLGAFTASLTPLQIFLLGVGAILVLSVGSALLGAGMSRRRRQRRELKSLRQQVAHDDRGHPRDRGRDRDHTVGGRTDEPAERTESDRYGGAAGSTPRGAESTGPGARQDPTVPTERRDPTLPVDRRDPTVPPPRASGDRDPRDGDLRS